MVRPCFLLVNYVLVVYMSRYKALTAWGPFQQLRGSPAREPACLEGNQAKQVGRANPRGKTQGLLLPPSGMLE